MTALCAAAYVRVASTFNPQDDALDVQEHAIRDFALEKDYQIVQVYSDIGSGLREDRPGLQELLHDAQAAQFSAVIVRDRSRLFRSSELAMRYEILLRDQFGVELITLDFWYGGEA